MTVAIKRRNGDLIWFDAILGWGQQYSATVTKHPIEGGGQITDHTTIDNPKLTIQGVVSDADFNMTRPIISSHDADNYGITQKQFVNNSPVTSSPEITYSASKYAKFLPEEAQKFLTQNSPTVFVPDSPKVMQSAFIENMLTTMWGETEEFELVEFQDDTIKRVFVQCVFTNVSFAEDPDSGAALYANLSIEQVKFATSVNVKIPQRVSDAMKPKTAEQRNKGKQAVKGDQVETTEADKGNAPSSASDARGRIKTHDYGNTTGKPQ
ncbi:hypothetical protein P5706_15600 [Pseudomonas sp. ChxA]|uniref:phage baseplate protein n=1 Tax=Pseudomonas sp. ChxA TaxID=3035473 RepID=UPI00255778EE|nr:hypothetical protein [Pseudomonas sp. ChxA]MDL2185609.1 hypothetical protein [Pseudomonas sp. ChxA]